MTTWTDLMRSIEDTAAIDGRLVLSIATTRAHKERAAWAKVGLPRTWQACFAEAMTFTRCRAKTILDNELASRERRALPVSEQWARTAELEATICEKSIPPRPEQARHWRELAANLRRSQFYAIAAE